MGSSILSEVDDTSILRTGLSFGYWRPLNRLRPLGSCPRAAGWSAATLCIGPQWPCWQSLTMSAVEGRPAVQSRCRDFQFDATRDIGGHRFRSDHLGLDYSRWPASAQ